MLALLLAAWLAAPAELKFEAEDWTTPTDAWLVDRLDDTHWNLWSTDQNAAAKWSGGVVLQSPRVLADRATPTDGAPPLHTVITGLPDGRYDVSMNSTRAIGLSFDGTTWQRSTGGLIATDVVPRDGRFELWVDDRYLNADNPGSAYYDYLLFTPVRAYPPRPKVEGWATERAWERLDRGLVAVTGAAGAYLSWRLLPDDPAAIAFNAYRDGTRLNAEPIARTCDLVDAAAPATGEVTYTLRPVVGGREGEVAASATLRREDYLSIPLDGPRTIQKLGLGDLDGDGRLDYVLKTPADNIDPYIQYWKRSPDTYKLEAFRHDGTPLWTHDLGWAIERGMWYSPYLVWDFDGDGRAEVAAKIGEGDPRDADGRVTSGPEWVAILDGATGRERCRAPWPSRDGFGDGDAGYNHAARNQLAVAYLDGRTPCLLALRGTYTIMKVDAWQMREDRLEPLWQYSSELGGRRLRGQGAHFTQSVDLDDDGRDEVVLGSVVLDDDGTPLWSTGLGHPDHAYIGDHDPARPGLEIYYGVETRQQRNGMCLVDARTGTILWGWDQPTGHIHATGLCSDIDPTEPGAEMYGADSVNHEVSGDPWLWNATGKLLSRSLAWSFGRHCAWWDADLQREVLAGSSLVDFGGRAVDGLIAGSVVLVADVVGDWREEVICSLPGELRIHATTVPAFDRRTTLLADPLYRQTVAMCAMGYTQVPTLRDSLEALAPNLNLTLLAVPPGEPNARVVVSAPRDRGVRARLTLEAARGAVEPAAWPIELAPGERVIVTATVDAWGDQPVTARLRGDDLDLATSARLAGGVTNGDFERAAGERPAAWTWWSREGHGGVTVTTDQPHAGRRAARIDHDGPRDWALSNTERLGVRAGQVVRVRGWARAETPTNVQLAVVGLLGGQTVTWTLAAAEARGPYGWREFAAEATVPDGIDEIYARWTGGGATRVWVDDVSLSATAVR